MSVPGGDGGRHIVIRRLDLGRIPVGGSAAALALHIERRAAAIWSEAVAFDRPDAAHADVVAFPDQAAPLVALARRAARGETVDQWFWHAAVPEWRAAKSSGERWRSLLAAAHRLPAAPVVAAAIVAAALAAGAESEIVEAVTSADAVNWCRTYGWSLTTPNAPTRAFLPVSDQVVRRALRHLDPSDARVTWLIALAAVHHTPALAADPLCAARVQQVLRARRARATGEFADTVEPAHRRDADSVPVSAASGPRTQGLPGDAGRTPSQEDGTTPASSPPYRPDGDVTAGAGLLLLIPVLARLGFADYVAARPELLAAAFPARLLLTVSERARLRTDDPLVAVLRVAVDESVAGPDSITRSGAWLDDLPVVLQDLLSSPRRRVEWPSPSEAWLTAVRRWCRRHARIGLASLVRRPGRLYASPTHLDVAFDLSQVDIRIRRQALDVDPGWVPWLGRVVQFHYVDRRLR